MVASCFVAGRLLTQSVRKALLIMIWKPRRRRRRSRRCRLARRRWLPPGPATPSTGSLPTAASRLACAAAITAASSGHCPAHRLRQLRYRHAGAHDGLDQRRRAGAVRAARDDDLPARRRRMEGHASPRRPAVPLRGPRSSDQAMWLVPSATPYGSFWPVTMVVTPVLSRLACSIVPSLVAAAAVAGDCRASGSASGPMGRLRRALVTPPGRMSETVAG